MNILFLVTGIGLGHSVREHSIIKKILKKYPKTKIKIMGYDASYAYFKKQGFDVERCYGHVFPGNQLRINMTKVMLTNFFYPIKFFINIFKVWKVSKKFNPDVIVCDIQPDGIFVGRMLRKKVVFVYNLKIDEEKLKGSFNWLMKFFKSISYKLIDVVINPQLENINKKEGNVVLISPVVRNTINELPSEKTLMKKLGFRKKPVLVQIGGSTFGYAMVESLISISEQFPEEQFVVFGFGPIKKKIGNVSFMPLGVDLLEYLKVSKAVITLAGHEILSEIIHFRKASLVFPIDYVEQMENAKFMKRHKLALVGNISQTEPDDLKLLIDKLLENRGAIEKRIINLGIMENGAEKAADIILKQKDL